jgi:hypothetical protein
MPPARTCTGVGPGDYVLTRRGWARIVTNSAHKRLFIPRAWTITTEDGRTLGVYDCLRYARAGDLHADVVRPHVDRHLHEAG